MAISCSMDRSSRDESFPAARPMLALDRVYARGARIVSLDAHQSAAARRASDHLPVIAHVEIPDGALAAESSQSSGE